MANDNWCKNSLVSWEVKGKETNEKLNEDSGRTLQQSEDNDKLPKEKEDNGGGGDGDRGDGDGGDGDRGDGDGGDGGGGDGGGGDGGGGDGGSSNSSTSNQGTKSNTPDNETIQNNTQEDSSKARSVPLDYPIIKQSFIYAGPSDLQDFYKKMIDIYKKRYFNFFFEQLEKSKQIVFLNEKLTKFFIKELKKGRSSRVIRALHGIHSLISNPLTVPRIIVTTLARDNFLSCLFDPKCCYNSSSLSFMTKEILIDILSELFHKVSPEQWQSTFLKILNDLCRKYFYDDMGPPSVYFHIITAYLAIGIEVLPEEVYASLKQYFNYMLMIVSGNRLSSDYISKVWDKLMLFCHRWVKYALSYSHLHPNSKIKCRNCVSPDFSIFQSMYVRDRLKYEFIHVEDGYVPCEYPLVPSFPKLPKTSPSLNDPANFWEFSDNMQHLTDDFIGVGQCSECNGANCSCVQDYIELEARKQLESSSESAMEVDEMQNVSLDEQNKPSSSKVSAMEGDGMQNVSLVWQNKPSTSKDGTMEDGAMEVDETQNVPLNWQNIPSCSKDPEMWFDTSDEDTSSEKMSDFNDSPFPYDISDGQNEASFSEVPQVYFDPTDEDTSSEEMSDF